MMGGFCVIDHHRRGETRSSQIIQRRFGMSLAECTPPGINQPRRHIVPPRDLGNAGTGREGLGQDLQPFLIVPALTLLGTRRYRDLTHRPLLSALSRTRLRPLAYLTDKAGSAGWVPLPTPQAARKVRPASTLASAIRGSLLHADRGSRFDAYSDAVSGFLQDLPEPRRDLVIGVSYHIVASAIVSRSRGDDPTLIDMSWAELAQEMAKAATGYLEQAR
jgi:hypothetical protein